MRQTMKQTLLALTTLSVFSVGAVNADSCYSSCDANDCSWNVDVFGEFLYWKPCFDNLDYAISVDDNSFGSTPANGKTLYVDHNWKPGFRVGLGFEDVFCGWNLDFDYARVEGSDSSSAVVETTNGAIYSTLYHGDVTAVFDEASSKHSFTYQDYNVLFSKHCCVSDCHNFRPYVGVAGFVLDQTIRADNVVTGTVNDHYLVSWDADYTGTGLRFGSGYNYDISSCFSFFFDGSFALVYGNADTKEQFEQIDDNLVVNFDYTVKSCECLFVPGLHIALGFKYDMNWCGTDFALTVGYEFLNWFNVPTPRRYADVANPGLAIGTSGTTGSVGFHGIRVGLLAGF